MTIRDMKKWVGRAAVVRWIDSGSWNLSDEMKPQDMDLSITSTSGIIVFVNRKKVVVEHEKEAEGFGRQSHSVIWPKAVLTISSKRGKDTQ